MDDELHRLETELQHLRPAAPSPALLARLERELATNGSAGVSPAAGQMAGRSSAPPRLVPVRWFWVAAMALPAAAAVALLFTQRAREQSLPPTGFAPAPSDVTPGRVAGETSSFKPVAAENVLVSARDEGLVTLDDGSPARRERLQYVDTITWKNSRTNASLTWSVPREEVRVVPVSFF